MLYETPEDIAAEAEITKTLERIWRADARKLPKKYCADIAMTRNGSMAALSLIEIKDRGFPWATHETLLLGVEKGAILMSIARCAKNTEVIFVNRFTDGILAYTTLHDNKYDVQLISRPGREPNIPHFLIPRKDFIQIKTGEN